MDDPARDWTPPPLAPRSHRAWSRLPPSQRPRLARASDDPSLDDPIPLHQRRAARQYRRAQAEIDAEADQRDGERRLQRAVENDRKRARIEEGNELRQPPEYRGRVFSHADSDGVHPTAFPPLRWGPQESLSEEFIDFQAHNGTTYARDPTYYCVACRIRYNARDGGKCGPCIGKEQAVQARQTAMFDDVPVQPTLPEYPA